jgi:hypothetical protein
MLHADGKRTWCPLAETGDNMSPRGQPTACRRSSRQTLAEPSESGGFRIFPENARIPCGRREGAWLAAPDFLPESSRNDVKKV